MDDDFLSFQADSSSPKILSAYDEVSLWSAMFWLIPSRVGKGFYGEVEIVKFAKHLDIPQFSND